MNMLHKKKKTAQEYQAGGSQKIDSKSLPRSILGWAAKSESEVRTRTGVYDDLLRTIRMYGRGRVWERAKDEE